jgi:hypothetical protein
MRHQPIAAWDWGQVFYGRFARIQSLATLAAGMTDVTRILSAIGQGDPRAAEQLLPLVYDELRRLAALQLGRERPGQTLDATALVHEAYLRLVGEQQFANRRHFFGAAAEAMRPPLVSLRAVDDECILSADVDADLPARVRRSFPALDDRVIQ